MLYGTKTFPRSIQLNNYTCGPRCVHSIFKYFKLRVPYKNIEKLCKTTPKGTYAYCIVQALLKHRLSAAIWATISKKQIRNLLDMGRVLLCYVDDDHYVVVHGMDNKWVYLSDPLPTSTEGVKMKHKTFKKRFDKWCISIGKAV